MFDGAQDQCGLPPLPVCDQSPVPPSISLQVLCEGSQGLLADYRYVRLLGHIDPTRYCLGSDIECAEAEILTWNAVTQNWDASGTIICVCDFVGNRMHQYDRAIVKQEDHCVTTEHCGAQDCEGAQGAQAGGTSIWWIHEVHEFGCWALLTGFRLNAFSWLEKIHVDLGAQGPQGCQAYDCAWADPPCPRSGEYNAFEANCAAEPGLVGRIVWLRRGADDKYVFNSHRAVWVKLTARCERAYSGVIVVPQCFNWPVTEWAQCADPILFEETDLLLQRCIFDVNGCAFNVQGGVQPLITRLYPGSIIDPLSIFADPGVSCLPPEDDPDNYPPYGRPIPFYLIDLGGTNECDSERFDFYS